MKGIDPELAAIWNEDGAVICHGTVTYTWHDSTTPGVPFANIPGVVNELISEYLIFIDVSELYGSA